MGDPISNLGISCPESSNFYVCEDKPSRFLGCCTINPCTTDDGLCPDDDLQPASFNPDDADKLRGQNCPDPGFQWYVCSASQPTFFGCCSQDACGQDGCPNGKVGAASLSNNQQGAAPFLPLSSSTTSPPTSTTSSSSSSSSTSATGDASSTTLSTAVSTTASATSTQPAAASPQAHTGLSKGAIGGIAVGAVAGGCILTLLVFWALKQRKKRRPTTAAAASSGDGKDEDGEGSTAQHRDDTTQRHMLHGQPSPGLDSLLSELPVTPSTPGNRQVVSMASSDGVTGRESELSGVSASPKKSPQLPVMHQSLFELEDSPSRRPFVGR